MFTYSETRKFYDRFGAKQDKQFYENAAIDDLIRNGNFEEATSVFEFGCGTGKLAYLLLSGHLQENTSYAGIDVSGAMVSLATSKLREFGARVRVSLSDGKPKFQENDTSFDRVVSTYVLDLLREQDIKTVLEESHRILAPGGLICLAGLTYGVSFISRAAAGVWSKIHKLNPGIVGGCRPVSIAGFVSTSKWKMVHNDVIVSFGIPSEIMVAEKV